MSQYGLLRKVLSTVLYTSGKLNLDINDLITRDHTQSSVARYQLLTYLPTLQGRHTKVLITNSDNK